MTSTSDTTDIAILHDQWTEIGGAEQVAIEMARTLDAPIYAARVDDGLTPDDVQVIEAFDRWWLRLALRGPFTLQDVAQMIGWQHVAELYDYDTLIYNKNNPGWFVPKDDQTVVKYCHTTPRNHYDLAYKNGDHIVTRALNTVKRILYQPNISYPDLWLANSDLVQRRLDCYWDINSERTRVVYPPVPVNDYDPDSRPTGGYYLTVGRLWAHKHTDDILRAFRQLQKDDQDYQLVVVGDGPERGDLEAEAPANVEFRGYVTDAEKRQLYAGAKATIMAAENEDFGLVPIESMAAGTPVIGVKDGYTQHQLLHGENGLLFPRAGGHLREAIRHFERAGVAWSPSQIREFAEQFSSERFRDELRTAISDAQSKTAIVPGWERPDAAVDEDELSDPVVTDGGPP